MNARAPNVPTNIGKRAKNNQVPKTRLPFTKEKKMKEQNYEVKAKRGPETGFGSNEWGCTIFTQCRHEHLRQTLLAYT